nr:hypothetical protein [Tanacetum cinerariifolium]
MSSLHVHIHRLGVVVVWWYRGLGYLAVLLMVVYKGGRIYQSGILHFHERDLARSLIIFSDPKYKKGSIWCIHYIEYVEKQTIYEYMAQIRDDAGSGIVSSAFGDGVHFELKGQFLKELREKTFSGTEIKDANKYIKKVLEIVDLFHELDVNEGQLMIRRPITKINAENAKTAIQDMVDHSQIWNEGASGRRKIGGNSEGLAAITTQLSSLSREMKKLSEQVDFVHVNYELCNGSPLSKDCLIKEKVKEDEEIYYGEFYQRPYPNRGRPITKINAENAKTAIQDMVDHSQIWNEGASGRRKIGGNSEGLAAITTQLSSLSREMKKLSEQVDFVHVNYELCNGSPLSKDCLIKEKVKEDEEIYYGEFYQRPYPNRGRYKANAPGYYVKEEIKMGYQKRRLSFQNDWI